MLKTKELCEGCEQEYFEAFMTDDDVRLCASCYIEIIKSDNAALQRQVVQLETELSKWHEDKWVTWEPIGGSDA